MPPQIAFGELAMPRLAVAFAVIAVLFGGLASAQAAVVVTVDKSELSERVGRLPVGKVDAILRGLHLLFDRV